MLQLQDGTKNRSWAAAVAVGPDFLSYTWCWARTHSLLATLSGYGNTLASYSSVRRPSIGSARSPDLAKSMAVTSLNGVADGSGGTHHAQSGVEAIGRLERSVRLLLARAGQLEELVCKGEEAAWVSYLATLDTLARVLAHVTPGRRGELLTTSQMAARLNLSPKSLLRRKARGEIRPAVQRGKLIRWRGDEVSGDVSELSRRRRQ